MTNHFPSLLPTFDNISYLKNGSSIQQNAFHSLTDSKILYHLEEFDPVLTGTMPLDLFIAGKSDLDIVAQAKNFDSVKKILHRSFSKLPLFTIEEKLIEGIETLTCRFQTDQFPIELFFQQVPSRQQFAYRHMLVEYWLLMKFGMELKLKVLELKANGKKTEAAFVQAIGLTGDPYSAILNFEKNKEFQSYCRITP